MSVLYVRDKDGNLKSVPYVSGGGGNDGGASVPDYWQDALDNGVEAINAAMEAAGRNKSAFLWYHDSHWTNNSGQSPMLMKYLQDHTALYKVNFGGDIVSTEEAASRADWAYLYEWRDAVKQLKNHHSVRGNHDDDIPGLQTEKAIYGYLMAPEETPDIVRGGDFYYYIDDHNEKTRYLYLDTQVGTTLTNQGDPEAMQFVVDSLNSTPEDWHIIPIAHIWFLYDDYNTPKVGQIPDYCQQLLDVFDAHNARGSGSVTVNGTAVSYDFTSAVGNVEFCIGGHIHVDLDFTSTGGIPVILTEADQYEWRGGYDATPGTTGESCVDAIIADYDAKKVSVIRIGRGVSREVSLNGGSSDSGDSGDAEYTNVLDSAGYVAGKRLSASGGYTESDQSGVYLTGYIPISIGDTIYFKNMEVPNTFNTGYDQHLYLFDSNKAGLGHGHFSDYDNDDGIITAVWEEIDGVNYLKQFTFNGGTFDGVTYDTAAYIRINAVYIDTDSIISINQESTEDTGPKYNNVIKTSIDSTGAVFNSGAGWAANSRIGSGTLDDYVGDGNYYITGHIEIDPTIDNTIRLRNITFESATTDSSIGVAFYNSSFARVNFRYASSGDNWLQPSRMEELSCSPVAENGNTVEFTLIAGDHLYSDIKYFAICAGYIGDNSIITINELIT